MAAPAVLVNGTALPDRELGLLESVRVDRSMGLVGRATLTFRDENHRMAASSRFALGVSVELRVFDKPSAKFFVGEVTGVSLDQVGGEATLRVSVDDPGYKMASKTHLSSYLDHSYSDAISEIAGRHGLQADVSSTPEVHPYLLQTGTDLDMLNQLTALAGLAWWVDPDRTLRVRVPGGGTAQALTLGESEDLLRFSVRASGLAVDEVTVSGWDPGRKQAVTGTAEATSPRQSQFVIDHAKQTTKRSLKVAELSPHTTKEATELAKALSGRSTLAAVTAKGTCYANAALGPGVDVQVKGAGPASGTYTVTAVEHVYDRRGFLTHFTCGPWRPTRLTDVLGAPTPDAGLRHHGVLPAIVTQLGTGRNAQDGKVGTAKVEVRDQGRPAPVALGPDPDVWAPVPTGAWCSSPRSTTRCWSPSRTATPARR